MKTLTDMEGMSIIESMKTQRERLSIKKAANLLQVSPSTTRRMVLRYELEAVMVGHQWQIYTDSVESYLESHTRHVRRPEST